MPWSKTHDAMVFSETVDPETSERIATFGRVTAISPSPTATDWKVYFDVEPDALLHASEVAFATGMIGKAQFDTYHEPKLSLIWIGTFIDKALHCTTTKEIGQVAENGELNWQLHRARLRLNGR